MRLGFYLFTAFAAAGVYVSELLVTTHVQAVFANGGDTGICAALGGGCSDAARSGLSNLFGLPIAVLGEAFYLVLILIAGLRRFAPDKVKGLADVVFFSTLLGVLYSVFLGIASKVTLGKLCSQCMLLYAVNTALFATAWWSHPDSVKTVLRRTFGVFGTGGFWVTAVMMAVATLATQAAYASRAREAHARYQAIQEQLGGPAKHMDVDVGDAPGRGPADAPVVVVEFSDFECPFCSRLAANLKEAAAAQPGLFRYHFKHYPMDDACNPNIGRKFHEDACRAAIASVCAEQQGKFWEMHDHLFENRTKLGADDLFGYAEGLGLDMERFRACVDDPATVARIRKDIDQGRALGVGGTPTFFVNGWQMMGARKAEELLGVFEQARRDALKGKQP
ncbi:MAG: thioredoxin domain-containing protein [Myxococcales bacterium]|nr:thioredoxin domain-containing protein [Myxococcales bacterium]MCB9546819.1 thioredoxin domain-containing protein [Myxococcales bacterium]